MTTTTKGAVPKGAASGRSKRTTIQQNGKIRIVPPGGKSVKWRKLTLILPAEPPGSVWFAITQDDLSKVLIKLLGEEQWGLIEEQVDKDKLTMTKTIAELTDLITHIFSDIYSITPGE